MSFLADPPMLVGAGAAIERLAPDERTARRAELAVLALFFAVSGALYLEAPATRPMWRALRARSGLDWMINSGVLRLDTSSRTRRRDVAALAMFALYPSWLRAGRRLARRRSARPPAL